MRTVLRLAVVIGLATMELAACTSGGSPPATTVAAPPLSAGDVQAGLVALHNTMGTLRTLHGGDAVNLTSMQNAFHQLAPAITRNDPITANALQDALKAFVAAAKKHNDTAMATAATSFDSRASAYLATHKP